MRRVKLALSILDQQEDRYEQVCMTLLGQSWFNRAKTLALIAHDRILNSEEGTRGLPKAYK